MKDSKSLRDLGTATCRWWEAFRVPKANLSCMYSMAKILIWVVAMITCYSKTAWLSGIFVWSKSRQMLHLANSQKGCYRRLFQMESFYIKMEKSLQKLYIFSRKICFESLKTDLSYDSNLTFQINLIVRPAFVY